MFKQAIKKKTQRLFPALLFVFTLSLKQTGNST